MIRLSKLRRTIHRLMIMTTGPTDMELMDRILSVDLADSGASVDFQDTRVREARRMHRHSASMRLWTI